MASQAMATPMASNEQGAGSLPLTAPRSFSMFRLLWIIEMLMVGVDVLLVARMAGTSVSMVERVYGHFRSRSWQDAQVRLDRGRAGPGNRSWLHRANEVLENPGAT